MLSPDAHVKELISALTTAVLPLMVASVFVDAEGVRWDDVLREVGDNERHMSRQSDHRVLAISLALPRRSRMGVDVSHHRKPGAAAELPERTVARPIKDHDPGIQAVGVKIVIRHAANDASPALPLLTQQKSTALATAVATTGQVAQQGVPQAP